MVEELRIFGTKLVLHPCQVLRQPIKDALQGGHCAKKAFQTTGPLPETPVQIFTGKRETKEKAERL